MDNIRIIPLYSLYLYWLPEEANTQLPEEVVIKDTFLESIFINIIILSNIFDVTYLKYKPCLYLWLHP